MIDFATVFLGLLIAHAVTDFAMQPEWMIESKVPGATPPTYDPKKHGRLQPIWLMVLPAHAFVNAAGVWVVSGNLAYGMMEAGMHLILDLTKGKTKINPFFDQAMHVTWKILLAIIIVNGALK